MNKKIYNKGDTIGDFGIIFIKELHSKKSSSDQIIRCGLFKCTCGKYFENEIIRVKHNRAKSCGCLKIKLLFEQTFKHGLLNIPTYHVWKGIKYRINNKKGQGYKNYGGRGISMFPPWVNDFKLFYDYVSCLANFGEKHYSLDRIENNGDYEPGNLRWTRRSIQNTNKRPRKGHKYLGVSEYLDNKWMSMISVNGKLYRKYGFNNPKDALMWRNDFIVKNNIEDYNIQQFKI
jgi:hypothetical protein